MRPSEACKRVDQHARKSALSAAARRRPPCDLYHSALEVRLGQDRWIVEMAPVWNTPDPDRGVVAEGPVGLPWLGRSRLFRYEVRCWRAGRMWDSNSLTSWLLVRSGHDVSTVSPPRGGRAPGWAAGVVVAAREGTARAPSLTSEVMA